jgi:hypothetical protein
MTFAYACVDVQYHCTYYGTVEIDIHHHYKKRLAIFPSPTGIGCHYPNSLPPPFLGRKYPTGDGKIVNLFLHCTPALFLPFLKVLNLMLYIFDTFARVFLGAR